MTASQQKQQEHLESTALRRGGTVQDQPRVRIRVRMTFKI